MSKNRRKIILVCSDCLSRNYSLTKGNLTQKERLEVKKYCSTCNQHALHKESR